MHPSRDREGAVAGIAGPAEWRNGRALSQFCGQATKGVRWMPWRKQAMKDVASCDKPRGAASRQ